MISVPRATWACLFILRLRFTSGNLLFIGTLSLAVYAHFHIYVHYDENSIRFPDIPGIIRIIYCSRKLICRREKIYSVGNVVNVGAFLSAENNKSKRKNEK